MKLTLTEERFEFNFPNATALYKFDEKQPISPTYHGAPLQAVDVMAEFPTFQLWIEIKEFLPEDIEAMQKEGEQRKKNCDIHRKAYLIRNLKYKFRDTFLYRFCENELNKKIVYVCLTNFEDALNLHLRKTLSEQLPTGKPSKISTRWKKTLLDKNMLYVVNKKAWARTLKELFGECKKI